MQVRALIVCTIVIASCSKDEQPTTAHDDKRPVRAAETPHRQLAQPQQRTAPALPETSDANPPGVPHLSGAVQTEEGVSFIDEVVGTGAAPEKGKAVKVHYTGWLTDGTKFDSSVDRGDPINLRFNVGQVIKGWDVGLASMRVGGKRRLIIPAELGYGERGHSEVIPPDSTLVFDVELLEVGD
jgi:peptidylprolyl isomerase